MPFSPKIYKKATAARVNDTILLYTKELDNPREITEVSTCPTNHINNETKIVIISGTQYTKIAFSDAVALAMFGLSKKAKKAEAKRTRANA